MSGGRRGLDAETFRQISRLIGWAVMIAAGSLAAIAGLGGWWLLVEALRHAANR